MPTAAPSIAAFLAALDKWHVRYVERPGWRTRNTGRSWAPEFLVVHHDASKDTVSTERGLALIEGGRPDLRGPLADEWQEDDGILYLTAWGNANHGGRMNAAVYDRLRRNLPPIGRLALVAGGPKAHPDDGPVANGLSWGTEVHNAGDGRDPYEPGQMQNLVLFHAAVCDLMGWDPHARILAHAEITARKPDPSFDMGPFRDAVAVCLFVGPDGAKPTPTAPKPTAQEDDMPTPLTEAVAAADLVGWLYENEAQRPPDPAGAGYWLERLLIGGPNLTPVNPAQVVHEFGALLVVHANAEAEAAGKATIPPAG